MLRLSEFDIGLAEQRPCHSIGLLLDLLLLWLLQLAEQLAQQLVKYLLLELLQLALAFFILQHFQLEGFQLVIRRTFFINLLKNYNYNQSLIII